MNSFDQPLMLRISLGIKIKINQQVQRMGILVVFAIFLGVSGQISRNLFPGIITSPDLTQFENAAKTLQGILAGEKIPPSVQRNSFSSTSTFGRTTTSQNSSTRTQIPPIKPLVSSSQQNTSVKSSSIQTKKIQNSPHAETSEKSVNQNNSNKSAEIQKNVINCWELQNSGQNNSQVCITCDPFHFKINDTTCIPSDPFCRKFKPLTSTVCEICEPGYIVGSKGFCITDLMNCAEIDKELRVCNRCRQDYLKVNKGCDLTNKVCEIFSPSSIAKDFCVKCTIGLVPNINGTCFTVTRTGCERLGGSGICQKCYSEEYQALVFGQCINKNQSVAIIPEDQK